MEKIKLYEYPPIFHSMQYFEEAEKLKQKLKNDEVILQKNECTTNKIIFNKNLQAYYILLIDGATMTSAVCETNNKYQKLGWFIWLQNFNIATTYSYKNDDELYTYWFDKYFDKYFNDEEINIPYYFEAVQNYKNNNLYACVCCLFPLIEYLEKQISNFDGKEIFHIKKFLDQSQVANIDGYKKYFEEFEKQLNTFLKENIYKISTEKDVEPDFICRNRILHGIFTRNISKTDCLKLFCIVRSMDSFKGWLNCFDAVKKISELITELSKDLKGNRDEEN